MKEELGGKIIKKFVRLRGKTQSYLIDYGNEDKKIKRYKRCVIKIKLNVKIIKTVKTKLNLEIK